MNTIKIQRFIYGLLALLFSFLLLGTNAFAQSLSQDDQNSIYDDTVWYKPGVSSVSGCVPATLLGSDRAQQAWNYFISQTNPKLTPIQVAAILGNFAEESGIDPQKVQSDGDSPTNPLNGQTGWGIAQWTSLGRQQSLQDFANSSGAQAGTLPLQLSFAWKEAGDRGNLTALAGIQDLRAAVDYWMTNYESPNVPTEHEDTRYGDAKGFLILYGSNDSGSATTAAVPTSDCAGSTSGSLPSGSAQQIAAQLKQYINNGSLKCVSTAGYTAYNINCSDITNTANSISIKNQYCNVDALKPALLGMLLELLQQKGDTFTLTAICSNHSNTGTGAPGHSTGQAADFNTINGVFMGPDNTPWDQTKLQAAKKLDQDIASFMPSSTGFGQIGSSALQIACHPSDQFSFLNSFVTFPDSCDHQHVQVTG